MGEGVKVVLCLDPGGVCCIAYHIPGVRWSGVGHIGLAGR